MTNEELIEQMEKKLKEFSNINECDGEVLGEIVLWNGLAKYVLSLEIKARINELNLQANRIGLCADDAMERIEELENQLIDETLKLAGEKND